MLSLGAEDGAIFDSITPPIVLEEQKQENKMKFNLNTIYSFAEK